MEWRLLFKSSRGPLLYGVTVVTYAPVPFGLWFISRAPRAEWEAPLGPTWWWLIPAGLMGLTLVLPITMFWLHDRYVLRLEQKGDIFRLTTFLLWGRRTRELSKATFASAEVRYVEGEADYGGSPSVDAPYIRMKLRDGRGLIFDAAGEAPGGWDAIYKLGRSR
jgi:hypothetical protein